MGNEWFWSSGNQWVLSLTPQDLGTQSPFCTWRLIRPRCHLHTAPLQSAEHPTEIASAGEQASHVPPDPFWAPVTYIKAWKATVTMSKGTQVWLGAGVQLGSSPWVPPGSLLDAFCLSWAVPGCLLPFLGASCPFWKPPGCFLPLLGSSWVPPVYRGCLLGAFCLPWVPPACP